MALAVCRRVDVIGHAKTVEQQPQFVAGSRRDVVKMNIDVAGRNKARVHSMRLAPERRTVHRRKHPLLLERLADT